MPEVVSAEERFDLTDSLRRATSTATVRLSQHLEADLVQSGADKSFTVRWNRPGWKLLHDSLTKNTSASYTHQLGAGTIRISQTIPQNQWYLLGTPALQVTQALDSHDNRSRLELTFDNLIRKSALSCFKYFDAHQHKVHWHLDSHQGPALCCRTKAGVGLLHSVAVSISAQQGISCVCKSRPMKCAKLVANVRGGHVSTLLAVTPALPKRALGGSSALQIGIDHSLKGQQPPSLSVAVEWCVA